MTASTCIYEYNGSNFEVTNEMKNDYKEQGYVIIRNLLTNEEIGKVRNVAETSEVIKKHTSGRRDDTEKETLLCLWNHPGSDTMGALVRMKRFAGTMGKLMDAGEIYHYHTKLLMKNAKTGGAFLWHQDYGYWYYNGCLLPEMGSVFLAIDDCSQENGCLRILAGSHKMGRVDHARVGDQQQADPERLELAKKRFEEISVEMKAGDALFFHCNLLHTSAQNLSDKRRWVIVTGFNSKNNNPTKKHHHASYTPMEIVDDEELMLSTDFEQEKDKWFMDFNAEEDVTSYEKKV